MYRLLYTVVYIATHIVHLGYTILTPVCAIWQVVFNKEHAHMTVFCPCRHAPLFYWLLHMHMYIQSYPPPSVPRDFVPLHKFSNNCSVSEKSTEGHQKPLTSTERSQLLSDHPGTRCTCLCCACGLTFSHDKITTRAFTYLGLSKCVL